MRRSLNIKLHDAYIARDVLLRRVAAGIALQLDAKVVELGHELSAMTRRIDPIAPSTELEKMRRRKQLERAGSRLIVKRMREMRKWLVEQLKEVGIHEAAYAHQLLEQAMNGLI